MDESLVDRVQILKDIKKREELINRYRVTGFVDRSEVIDTILKLRLSDSEVAQVTAVRLSVSSVPFEMASNKELIDELIMQKDVLEAKLLEAD